MNEKSGLYIHIPFCKNKCPYCDFYSTKYNAESAEKYVDLVTNEMKKYTGTFDTIYFGGGTPSIIEPRLIGKIIEQAKATFDIDENCEITVECNPSKDLANDFILYKSYGVNRISLGMQSAVDQERFALGRVAGKNQVKKAVFDAKNAGIFNISLDLMLGTPKQTLASLDESFGFIEEMGVTHISAYMLKIEEGTKFYQMQNRLALPDEDTVAQMYLKTVSSLKSLGFNQYEISNFAKSGYESRHNNKYWNLTEYLGIGASAHSLWGGRRFYYDRQMNIVDDGIGNTTEEKIMLSLRLTKGVDKALITRPYKQFIDMGLMKETPTNLYLTPEGMLLSNTIISQLI